MNYLCLKCNIFRTSNSKSFSNHRRSCNNKKSIPKAKLSPVEVDNTSGILKHSKVSFAHPHFKNNVVSQINNSQQEDVFIPSPFSQNLDYEHDDHFFNINNPMDSFDSSANQEVIIEENKYILFQRQILSLSQTTRSDEFGDIISKRTTPSFSYGISKLNIGHTLPIIPWEKHSNSLNQTLISYSNINMSSSSSSSTLSKYSLKTPGSSSTINILPLHKKPSRGIPLTRDVLDIFIYCKKNWLSVDEGNNLLVLIHELFSRHPPMENFFLHKNMNSINGSLNRVVDSLYNCSDIHIPLPKYLHGGNIQNKILKINRLLNPYNNSNPHLIIATGIGLDIMETLAETLISYDFDQFQLIPILDIKNGERCISTFFTANYFKLIFDRVQSIYGSEVFPFCMQWALDSTPISGGGCGTKNVTPLNVRFLQFKDRKLFRTLSNCNLVGFLPCYTVSFNLFIYF